MGIGFCMPINTGMFDNVDAKKWEVKDKIGRAGRFRDNARKCLRAVRPGPTALTEKWLSRLEKETYGNSKGLSPVYQR